MGNQFWLDRSGQTWVDRVTQTWVNRPVPILSQRFNSLGIANKINIFQGDPRLFTDANGSYLVFKGGQPVLDQGLENMVMIKLLTRKGWVGNTLFPNEANHIGTDFEISFDQPITISALNDIRNAALKALKDPAFGEIEVEVENPESYRVDVYIAISPPTEDAFKLLITKNGLNWVAQKIYPASERE